MTDFLLVAWVSTLIELTRLEWMLGGGKKWAPGEKLKLLFAGYNGTRNTGSDVRVNEMIRQIRHVAGAENVDFSVMTQSFDRTKGYFAGTRQVFLPDVFPPFLYRETRRNHGVVACEGSMFKSKFANALTTMMIGSLGHASAENKLSVAYGAEAGHMDRLIEKMCARYVHDSLVITRNVESQAVLGKLGISTELGTDTAWTFEPHPDSYGRKALREAGWDGKTPILVLCPIHPFVWPVRASLAKYLARVTTGAYRGSQYRTVYFHESGAEVDRKFKHYLDAFVDSTRAFTQKHRVFTVLVAMERPRRRRLPRHRRANSRAPRLHLRRLRHVRAGLDPSPVVVHGFLALPRHGHLHAVPGRVRRRHHGRAYPQPHARTRPPAPFPHRGRSRPRPQNAANDGNAGYRG
jgi:hypothetical protein